MSEFDPYLKWLGIREATRPINHYRLLGLDLFESDPEVISMAADRQMTHVRTYQNGPNGDVSQQILNELARARRCLLVSEKKQEYDDEIRASMRRPASPSQPPSRAELAPPIPKPVASTNRDNVATVDPEVVESESKIGIKAVPTSRKSTRRRERKQLVWSLFGWVTGGLAAVGIAAGLIGSGILPNSTLTNGPDDEPKVAGIQPEQPLSTVGSVKPEKNSPGSTPTGTKTTPPKTNPPKTNPKDNTPPKVQPKTNQPVEPGITAPKNNPPKIANGDATNVEAVPTDPILKARELNKYPKPNAETRVLLTKIPLLISDRRAIIHFAEPEEQDVIKDQNGVTVGFQPKSSGGQRNVIATDDKGSLLVGLSVMTHKDRNLLSVKPIFLNRIRNAFMGMNVGAVGRPQTYGLDFHLAKPGYAVGEITVSALEPIKRLRIKFMRITESGLNSSDFYWSDWVGTQTGSVKTFSNDEGIPVIGLSSSFDLKYGISSLRLVGARETSPLTKKEPGIATTNRPTPGQLNPNIVAPNLARLAEPSKRDREKAMEIVDRVYRDSFIKMRSIRDVRRVAQQLVSDGKSDPDDPDGMYARFEKARQLGIASGDAKTSVEALRTISDHFEISFWDEVLDTIEDTELKANNDTQADFKQTMDDLVDEAILNHQYGPAGKLIANASLMAKRARNVAAQEKYKSLRKQVVELDKLSQQGEKARSILKVNPDDAEANLNQGDYLFVVADDYDAAFEFWRKSSDKKLKDLVEKESSVDKDDGKQLIGLAADWQSLGQNNRTARDRKCLERARLHCTVASSLLTGLDRKSALTRIKELDQILN